MNDGSASFKVGTVAIAGLGMLGASLGLALRRACPEVRVLGWARREASLQAALARGIVHAGSTRPDEVLPQADLTVICIPVTDTVVFAQAQARRWRPGSVVTDVGSTKARIVTDVAPALATCGVAFIGSHPMAGSEQSGLEHGSAEMYRRAIVFITPRPADAPAAISLVENLWTAVGARPVRIEPDRHDALVAHTSHVLHLVSAAAVTALLQDDLAPHGTAGGFRDFTRIAASSPEMWAQIFQENRDELLTAIDDLHGEVQRLRSFVEAGDWPAVHTALAAAKARRDAWLAEWNRLRSQ